MYIEISEMGLKIILPLLKKTIAIYIDIELLSSPNYILIFFFTMESNRDEQVGMCDIHCLGYTNRFNYINFYFNRVHGKNQTKTLPESFSFLFL